MSAVNNHLSTGSEDRKFKSSTNTTAKQRPTKTTHNGTLTTRPTTILHFGLGDWSFKETFIVAKWLTGPILGLTFLKNNSAILDVSQGLLHFPHLTYSIETDEYSRNRKLYKVQIKSALTIPPETTETITAYTNIASTIDTTGVINPPTNHCSGDPLVPGGS